MLNEKIGNSICAFCIHSTMMSNEYNFDACEFAYHCKKHMRKLVIHPVSGIKTYVYKVERDDSGKRQVKFTHIPYELCMDHNSDGCCSHFQRLSDEDISHRLEISEESVSAVMEGRKLEESKKK